MKILGDANDVVLLERILDKIGLELVITPTNNNCKTWRLCLYKTTTPVLLKTRAFGFLFAWEMATVENAIDILLNEVITFLKATICHLMKHFQIHILVASHLKKLLSKLIY